MAETANAEIPAETKPEEEQPKEQPAEEAAPEPPKEMRAIVLTGFGGLKSVKVMKKPEPTVAEGEALIRVKACGLNFLDLMVRQGVVDNLQKTPFIMGFECSGEIEAIGDGVEDLQVGDSVIALTEFKAWAELVSVSAKYIYKIPVGMSYQDAAAIAMNYVVAYALLFDVGGVKPGQSVLLHSAGGGVGQAVSQLCKTQSDITTIGTASKSKHESIQDSFTHLIEHGVDYIQEVKKIVPEGVDLVLDCLYGEDANKGYSILKPLGKYVLYGTSNIVTGETKSFFSVAKSWWQVDKVSPIKLFDDNRTLAGFHLRHLLYQQGGHEYVRETLNKVFDMWRDGRVKPVIDSTWALEDIAEAMQKMHDRKNVGKLILDPSKEPKPKPVKTKESKESTKEAKDSAKDSKEKESKEASKDKESKAEEAKEETAKEEPAAE